MAKCGPKNGSLTGSGVGVVTDPILVPFFFCIFGTEIGSAGRTLNRPLQKARFTFQALLEFDRRVWMDRLTVYIHDLGQVDACIVAVARLVSLWRDTCNYSITGRHLLLTIRCAWNMPLPASSPVPPLAKDCDSLQAPKWFLKHLFNISSSLIFNLFNAD